MTAARWIYNRIGQMTCFAAGGLALAGAADGGDALAFIAASLPIFYGVLLKAIFHWRQMDDPNLV